MIEREIKMTESKPQDFLIDRIVDRVSHSKLVKGLFLGTTVLGGAEIVNACTSPPAETAPVPGNTASAESPYVKYTPSPEVTAAATSMPTPNRPDFAGGAYSAEQQNLIEAGAFKDIEQTLSAWFKYWANAINNPFHPQTTDIHFKYVFDSTGKNAGVCMESNAYSGTCFALPIINGEVATAPPTTNGQDYTIPVGYGPLQLSDVLTADQVLALKLDTSLTDSVLGFESGNWVRIKNGQVVGTLDMGTAQWKVKDKYEINQEKLHSPIVSYEYLEANLDKYNQVPDPLADKAAFDQKIDEIRATFSPDATKREENVIMVDMGDFGVDFVASDYNSPSALQGQAEMVYFVDNGTVYPILILNVGYKLGTVRTMAIILFNGNGAPEGTGVIQSISEGKKIIEVGILEKQNEVFPDFVNKILGTGLTGKDLGSYFLLGIGRIKTQ